MPKVAKAILPNSNPEKVTTSNGGERRPVCTHPRQGPRAPLGTNLRALSLRRTPKRPRGPAGTPPGVPRRPPPNGDPDRKNHHRGRPRRPRRNPRPEPRPREDREPPPLRPRLILRRGPIPDAERRTSPNPRMPRQRRDLHRASARALPAPTTGAAALRHPAGRGPARGRPTRLTHTTHGKHAPTQGTSPSKWAAGGECGANLAD